ncbi:MAG: hypothetical protein ACYC63_01170 [Armatimonadota bacterium]
MTLRQLLLLISTLGLLTPLLAQERFAFREPCDEKPVLSYWCGKKPLEMKSETVATDPAPAEGKGCTRLTLKWDAAPGASFSYFMVNSFKEIELRNGVNYRFRGKVWCPKGIVNAKVRWLVDGKEVIWHADAVKTGGGWAEFNLEKLREMALAIAPKDFTKDRIVLAAIFFNFGDNQTVVAVDDLKVTAEGTPLPQYVRPQECKFALPVKCPLLRFEIEGACDDLVVMGKGFAEPVFTAAPYPDAAQAGKHVYFAAVASDFTDDLRWWKTPPSEITATGKGKIVSVSLCIPDGDLRNDYRTEDNGKTWTFFFDQLFPLHKLPPINVGVYYAPYTISDPSMLPSSAWLWQPKPEQVAPYDFSVIQTSANFPSREFCDKIKQLNPEHKIILRLPCERGAIPKYWHETYYREGFLAHYNRVIERAGRNNIYAVSVGEEETGNFMSGLWWTNTPPDWVAMYQQPFERETGQKLTWTNAVCGNTEYLEWMKPKIRFFFNDVYDRLKQQWPDLPVLQYLAIANDTSEISWLEPGEIKADGWVYWGFHQQKAPVLITCQVPGEARPQLVWMNRDRMFRGLQRIRNSGVDNEMIFHCGFAHEPEGKYYDTIEQIKMLQEQGYRNSFQYFPCGAFLEKSDARDAAKVGEMEQGDYKLWRERRQRVLEYMKSMK